MAINIEKFGTSIVIQHYVGEVIAKDHCLLVSTSDIFTPQGSTKLQVIWDLSVKSINDSQVEFTNLVIIHPTEEFLHVLENQGFTFEQAAQSRQATLEDHNGRETPLFAESIERASISK